MTKPWMAPWLAYVALAGLACDEALHRPDTSTKTSAAPSPAASHPSGMRSPFAPKSTGPSLAPAPDHHGVGNEAKSRDYAMQVRHVGPCTVEAHFQPRKGIIKLGVEVEIQNLGTVQVPANALYAKLKDSAGETFPATLAGCAPMLTATRLEPGQTVKGTITFDIPENAEGLVMTYAPFIVGSGAQELHFTLGR